MSNVTMRKSDNQTMKINTFTNKTFDTQITFLQDFVKFNPKT